MKKKLKQNNILDKDALGEIYGNLTMNVGLF